MQIETYIATIRYNHGTFKILVASVNGLPGAIAQILTEEEIPAASIRKIKKIGCKKIFDIQ